MLCTFARQQYGFYESKSREKVEKEAFKWNRLRWNCVSPVTVEESNIGIYLFFVVIKMGFLVNVVTVFCGGY